MAPDNCRTEGGTGEVLPPCRRLPPSPRSSNSIAPSSASPSSAVDLLVCLLVNVPARDVLRIEVTPEVNPSARPANEFVRFLASKPPNASRSRAAAARARAAAFACLRFFFSAFAMISSTSPIPIPLPTHHHHPNQICQRIAAKSRCCSHSMPSSATATKLNVVDIVARKRDPTPKAAVPPSNLHARRRLTKKPQMAREMVKMRRSVELNTLRMASEMSNTVCELVRAANVKADETRAKGPAGRIRSDGNITRVYHTEYKDNQTSFRS